MKPGMGPEALYYPFHLCHQETLGRLLTRFERVHFRDFMALQFTRFSGMTAFRDRMGDGLPELLKSGRLVQGYDLSGPLPSDVAAAIDRDLDDEIWRALFHLALREDVRFQRGLFQVQPAGDLVDDRLQSAFYSVDRVRAFSDHADRLAEADLEYGLALVKTSASLVYTYRLSLTHGLQAATDSAAHYSLFERSCRREVISVGNHLLLRKGY
jgi:hypothetical protein